MTTSQIEHKPSLVLQLRLDVNYMCTDAMPNRVYIWKNSSGSIECTPGRLLHKIFLALVFQSNACE